jgi:hypothetical protein
VEVERNTSVPIYNLWRHYTQLPNNGLENDNFTPTIAIGGAGNLSDSAAGQFGINARNRAVVTILNELRNLIYPDAAP